MLKKQAFCWIFFSGIFVETEIVCTDIDLCGLLNFITTNVQRNKHLLGKYTNIRVMELNFKNRQWSMDLKMAVHNANVIFAADGKKILNIDDS